MVRALRESRAVRPRYVSIICFVCLCLCVCVLYQ